MNLPRLSLSAWILIGALLGIVAGFFFGDLCSALEPFTSAFIKLWQITVLPTVAVSLVVGVGSLKRDTAKSFAVKAVLVFVLIWILCLVGYFSFQLAFPPKVSASFFSTQDLTGPGDIDLVSQFIPANIFGSLADGIIPATVIFCLLLGFALMLDDGSGPVMNILRVLMDAFSRMMRYVAWTFPLGTFVIMTVFVGTLTIEGFLDLQVYLVTLAAAGILIGLVALPLLVTCFTPFTYREVLSAASEPLILAFTTGNDFITLPLIAHKVQELFSVWTGSPDDGGGDPAGQAGGRTGGPATGDVESYTGILVPIAYTVPMLGGLAALFFILFVAWSYQDPLSLVRQGELILLGLPMLFGSSKVAVMTLLDLLHLPADAYNLYISAGVISYSITSPLGVISNIAFTAIAIALVTGKAVFRWKQAVLSLVIVIVLAALIIAGLSAGFAYLLAGTYHGDEEIARMEMPPDPFGNRLDRVVNTTVYLRQEDVPPVTAADKYGGDEVRRIRERGFLRVGYNSHNVPFAFFNSKGELVGYDVEMAYDLARNLNVTRIEFVPVASPSGMADALDSGYCDIVMSAVTVKQEWLESAKFTDPYVTVHLAFVVPDGSKGKYTQLSEVEKMDGVRIAAFNNTGFVEFAQKRFPRAVIVPVDSQEEFFKDGRADVLIVPAEEGYPMTLQYPSYDVAIVEPNDVYQMMYAYPVAKNSSESYLLALNYWLRMEQAYGMLDKKYDYWVQGKVPAANGTRWSVVKDVLHWVN